MNLFIILTIIIIYIFIYCINNKKERFENSESVLKNINVYISFTTIPSRIAHIDEMLKSVDIPEVYEIHLNLENHLNYDEYHVERLKKITPKLKIFWSSDKIGPLSKIVPTLERLLGTNSLVISVDDDTIYNKINHIKGLINNYDKNNGRVIIGNNVLILSEYSPITKNFKKFSNKIHIVEGGSGILYPVNLITTEMLNEMKELAKLSKECYKSDDLTINLILEKHNIQRRNIDKNRNISNKTVFDYADFKYPDYGTNDALHLLDYDNTKFANGNASNYYHCANLIIDKGIL